MPSTEPTTPPSWARHLPWIDSLAALSVGIVLLVFSGALARLYGLSAEAVRFIGGVNAAYSLGGFALGVLRRRPILGLVITANLAWALVCGTLAARHLAEASVFGLGHLLGEGLFVSTLAVLEWRYRGAILADQT